MQCIASNRILILIGFNTFFSGQNNDSIQNLSAPHEKLEEKKIKKCFYLGLIYQNPEPFLLSIFKLQNLKFQPINRFIIPCQNLVHINWISVGSNETASTIT